MQCHLPSAVQLQRGSYLPSCVTPVVVPVSRTAFLDGLVVSLRTSPTTSTTPHTPGVVQVEKSCMHRCLEDLHATTRYVTWSLHTKNSRGLKSMLSKVGRLSWDGTGTCAPRPAGELQG